VIAVDILACAVAKDACKKTNNWCTGLICTQKKGKRPRTSVRQGVPQPGPAAPPQLIVAQSRRPLSSAPRKSALFAEGKKGFKTKKCKTKNGKPDKKSDCYKLCKQKVPLVAQKARLWLMLLIPRL
jgi:hypothetical protein